MRLSQALSVLLLTCLNVLPHPVGRAQKAPLELRIIEFQDQQLVLASHLKNTLGNLFAKRLSSTKDSLIDLDPIPRNLDQVPCQRKGSGDGYPVPASWRWRKMRYKRVDRDQIRKAAY